MIWESRSSPADLFGYFLANCRNETSDTQQGKGLEKDDTLKQKEAEAQVTNSRMDLLGHFVF